MAGDGTREPGLPETLPMLLVSGVQNTCSSLAVINLGNCGYAVRSIDVIGPAR